MGHLHKKTFGINTAIPIFRRCRLIFTFLGLMGLKCSLDVLENCFQNKKISYSQPRSL